MSPHELYKWAGLKSSKNRQLVIFANLLTLQYQVNGLLFNLIKEEQFVPLKFFHFKLKIKKVLDLLNWFLSVSNQVLLYFCSLYSQTKQRLARKKKILFPKKKMKKNIVKVSYHTKQDAACYFWLACHWETKCCIPGKVKKIKKWNFFLN